MTDRESDGAGAHDGERRVSRLQKVTAARIRVNVDKQRGVATPQWIVDLAAQQAS